MADREDISYLSDIGGIVKAPSGGTQGNIPVFGQTVDSRTTVVDSGKKPSDFVSNETVDQKVQEANREIWNAVRNEYALESYKSGAWGAGNEYVEGSFCLYLGEGYRCTESHVSGNEFDREKWEKVLSSSGVAAIDAILDSITVNGGANLSDIAPEYSSNIEYSVNQLVVKDGTLQICTSPGRGPVAIFSIDATVENAIENRFASLVIPTKVSDLTDDSGHLYQDALDKEYDTSEGEYAVGSTCTHGGRFYKCVRRVLQDAEWSDSDWEEIAFKEFVGEGLLQKQADWDETDSSSPSFIRNKPDIEAELDLKVGFENLPYRVEVLEEIASDDPYKIKYQLKNRTVNIVRKTISGNTSQIVLLPPNPIGPNVEGLLDLSRDFYVVLEVTTSESIPVIVSGSSLNDYEGSGVSLSAPKGSPARVVYRLTEISTSGNVFLATCMGDASYRMAREIDMALDDILKGSGIVPDVSAGVYVMDQFGLYHKLVAVVDEETGECNIGIEQEGTSGPVSPDEEESGSGSSSGEG